MELGSVEISLWVAQVLKKKNQCHEYEDTLL